MARVKSMCYFLLVLLGLVHNVRCVIFDMWSEEFEEYHKWFEDAVNDKDSNGKTLLHHAAERGDFEAVKCLVGYGINMNPRVGWDGQTPLGAAVENGHTDVERYLIAFGADVGAAYPEYRKLLLDASGDGDFHAVKAVIAVFPKILSYFESDRESTPLQLAAGNGHLEIVEFLIQSGADPNFVPRLLYDQLSPICIASRNGHLDIVKCLLKNGAKGKKSALDWAYSNRHFDIVRCLMSFGAHDDEFNSKSVSRNCPKLNLNNLLSLYIYRI